MSTISQREMRNESGRVLRDVEHGASFTITRHGTPVARIVPYEPESLPALRPARQPAVFSVDDLVASDISSEEILADLRDER
ncbi:MAG: type II toxin-antitoxin system prevent-host-death family antitoxin [Aeromicrobium sp.]|uniref:type II toxin-antitoxin system Phd/YefM family antitoxin n=1 Tax=Aeromicrobium sp. TaxID=1871063 RepID=UPI0039E61919